MNEKIKAFFMPQFRKAGILVFILALPLMHYLLLFVFGPFAASVGNPSVNAFLEILLNTVTVLELAATMPFAAGLVAYNIYTLDELYTQGGSVGPALVVAGIITVFWWYFISCLIVYIKDLIKERKNSLSQEPQILRPM